MIAYVATEVWTNLIVLWTRFASIENVVVEECGRAMRLNLA